MFDNERVRLAEKAQRQTATRSPLILHILLSHDERGVKEDVFDPKRESVITNKESRMQ